MSRLSRTTPTALLMILMILPAVVSASPGDPDSTFHGTGSVRFQFGDGSDSGHGAALQSDGKLVVGGFSEVSSSGDAWSLIRYNTDGSLDPTFGAGGTAITQIGGGGICNAVQIMSDGRIVTAGIAHVDGAYGFAVVRYLTDGSLDASFGGDGIVTTRMGTYDQVTCMAIQPDGKVVVGGSTYPGSSGSDVCLIRLNVDGTFDASFSGDGKEIFGGASDDVANAMALQSGKIVLAGYSYIFGEAQFAVHRRNSDGSADATFQGGSVYTDVGGTHSVASAVVIVYSGMPATPSKILVAGSSYDGFFTTRQALVRYNLNGTLDTGFDVDGKVLTIYGDSIVPRSLTLQSTGLFTYNITVGGTRQFNGDSDFALVRYLSTGALDTSFDGDGGVFTPLSDWSDEAGCMLYQYSTSKYILAGTAGAQDSYDFAVVRYNLNGSLDTSFDGDGIRMDNLGTQYWIHRAVAVQADDKLILAGRAGLALGVARCDGNGVLDPSFGGDGTKMVYTMYDGNAVALQEDDKILVAGGFGPGTGASFRVARLHPDGSLDATFGSGGTVVTVVGDKDDEALAMAIQDDGKILVAGLTRILETSYVTCAVLIRYNTNGSLDTSFHGDGIVTTRINDSIGTSVAIQPDGKIVVAGSNDDGTFTDVLLLRYNTDGTLDTQFSGDGKVITPLGSGRDATARALKLLSGGRILVAGDALDGSDRDGFLSAYLANGTLDATFGDNGTSMFEILPGDDAVNALALQTDGKILTAGSAFDGSRTVFTIARHNADGSPDDTYGDSGATVVDFAAPGNHSAYGLVLDSAGRALVAGDSESGFVGVARLLGGDAPVTAVLTDPAAPPPIILQLSPNPSPGRTRITFSLSEHGPVTLRVFSPAGRHIATLLDRSLEAGPHAIEWDGTDDQGQRRPSGVYFIRLEVEGHAMTQQVVLVR